LRRFEARAGNSEEDASSWGDLNHDVARQSRS
jgi:hypothetical protein